MRKHSRINMTKNRSALAPNAKNYLFGSPARGTHSLYSDVDIAIDTGTKIPLATLGELTFRTRFPTLHELRTFR